MDLQPHRDRQTDPQLQKDGQTDNPTATDRYTHSPTGTDGPTAPQGRTDGLTAPQGPTGGPTATDGRTDRRTPSPPGPPQGGGSHSHFRPWGGDRGDSAPPPPNLPHRCSIDGAQRGGSTAWGSPWGGRGPPGGVTVPHGGVTARPPSTAPTQTYSLLRKEIRPEGGGGEGRALKIRSGEGVTTTRLWGQRGDRDPPMRNPPTICPHPLGTNTTAVGFPLSVAPPTDVGRTGGVEGVPLPPPPFIPPPAAHPHQDVGTRSFVTSVSPPHIG